MSNIEPKYVVHNGRVHSRFEHRHLVGYRAEETTIPVVTTLPCLRWQGKKIPIALWREVLAFFKWSYKETRSETQVRIFHNFTTGEWKFHAFPQEKGTGMTTRELPDHPNRAEDEKVFEGWEVWGTVHHHCAMAAFQSSTDRGNEESQAGLHITVGNMDKLEHDIHSRVTVVLPGELDAKGELVRAAEKVFYDTDLYSWFELPPEMQNCPAALRITVLKYYLVTAAADDETFPQRWKDNVIEVRHALPNGVHHGGYHPGVVYPQYHGGMRAIDPRVIDYHAQRQAELALQTGGYRGKGTPDDAAIEEMWKEYYGGLD